MRWRRRPCVVGKRRTITGANRGELAPDGGGLIDVGRADAWWVTFALCAVRDARCARPRDAPVAPLPSRKAQSPKRIAHHASRIAHRASRITDSSDTPP